MKALLGTVAYHLLKMLLQHFLDSKTRVTVYDAVDAAEKTGEPGQTKMEIAINKIRTEGTDMLRGMAETHLRTLVELALDRLL